MRLVIFDFCDTITNFQTANEFCKFVLKKESKYGLVHFNTLLKRFYIYRVISKMGLKSWFSEKTVLLSRLKGISSIKMDEFAMNFIDEVIETNLNLEVYNRFLNHIKIGDVVVLNSGGYEPYLKLFAKKYGVNHCFSTQLEYTNNIFKGRVKGKDCLGEEKVIRMITAELLNNTYSDIVVYSDSITDMPIFNLATHKIAVIKESTIPSWCDASFEIISVK